MREIFQGVAVLTLMSAATATLQAQVVQVDAAFFAGASPLTFDDAPNNASLHTRYTASRGIGFSNDLADPNVRALDWTSLGRVTTSPQMVLGTHGSRKYGHLNIVFTEVQHSFGAYFGNDQAAQFRGMQLTVFGPAATSLGSVYVAANNNTSVDQFIGLHSLTGFTSARLQVDQSAEYFSVEIDDLVWGVGAPAAVVPEPASVVLLGTGLLLIGARALRRRAAG